MEPDDVVITGVGALCGGGRTATEVWRTLVDGRTAVRANTGLGLDRDLGIPACAPVPGFEGAERDRPLALRFGCAALTEAMAGAGLDTTEVDIVVTAHHGERTGRPDRLPSIAKVARTLANTAGASRSLSVFGACAGGTQAVGAAFQLVRSGRAGVALAGGADCLLRDLDCLQFRRLGAMSTRPCDPSEASCPFDRRRDGFVMGEGAAFVVLERADRAIRRGADVLAVVRGYGSSQNAHDLVAPPPDGLAPALALRAALDDARVAAADIGYINAHGTSTLDNDWSEAIAIRRAFGSAADTIPVSSIKGSVGHAMGAAGAIEIVVSVFVLREQVAPPTANLVEPDPRCDLAHVACDARPLSARRVLSNGSGFGGHNAAIILEAA